MHLSVYSLSLSVYSPLGFSPESSKVKQSPNKSHQSGQGFPPSPPKVVGFSPSLDTFQGIAEPRKVPLFPLPGEAAEDFAGRVIAKRDPLDRRELEALHKLHLVHKQGGDVRHIVSIPVVEPPVWDCGPNGRTCHVEPFLLSVGLRG